MTSEMLQSIDPASGEVVGEVAVTPPGDVPRVVARARAAQEAWGELSHAARIDMLRPAGAKLAARANELGRLLTREMGKPLREGVGEVTACAHEWEKELEGIAAALGPVTLEDDATRSTIYRDPYGVCAAITPWNFPMLMPHWHLLPALVAGNTVVFKPSEETPLIGQAYADVLNETLPDGVLNVVHGDERQGRALVDADVDLITFTGSREAGKHIMAAASKGLKRLILELGGKDPLLVLDGADVQKAAEFAAGNSFRNCGQVCVSTERIYVVDSLVKPFTDALLAEASKIKVGAGLDEATTMGPLVNRRQREHVQRQIRSSVELGARVAAGGPETARDNFMEPTVLVDVTNDMPVAQVETFGPVASVIRVKDDAEAVKLANDSKFGLGAVVFGEESRAARAARKLCAGMVGVNRGIGGAKGGGGTPWVGARESGFGFHSGAEGHRQFCQVRVVSVPKG